MRLIRIVKLYKNAYKVMELKKQRDAILLNEEQDRQETETGIESEKVEVHEQSNVGKKLSDLTMKRVILVVLTMLFTFPFLTSSTYLEEEEAYKFGLDLIHDYSPYTEAFNSTFDNYVEETKGFRNPLV